MNNAFMFPGQGSQYVGMAKSLYDNPEIRKLFDKTTEIINDNIADIMFEGPNDRLTESKNTQVAILLHSYSVYSIISKTIKPTIVCGHSLGEYSALVASNVISFEDAVSLVRKRGELMSLAGEKAKGSMAAVIGMKANDIESIIDDINGVVIANYNGPLQTVISGEDEAIDNAIKMLNKNGARRVLKLNVSGAFHSQLMNYAYEEFSEFIEKFTFNNADMDIILNVTGYTETDGEKIKESLKKQIVSPVKWTDTMNILIDANMDKFYEIGPKKALSGMIKRLTDKKIIGLDTMEDINMEVNNA